MRRADRLFDIIQLLRGAVRPMTASGMAKILEVSSRTVYRDIAALQGSGVPVEGASGLGYVLHPGYDLPPLMFTPEEAQTIAVALELVRRTGDRGLQEAAARVRAKLAVVVPPSAPGRQEAPFHVSSHGAHVPDVVCMSEVREAIRAGRKLHIRYLDRRGWCSDRVVWPLAVAYFMESTLIGAWCELRCDYRHFRTDRIQTVDVLEACYPINRPDLLAGWRALHAPGLWNNP